MAAKREEKLVAVRLEPNEFRALEKMVAAGFATNVSEAIRLAIRVAPIGLVSKLQSDIGELAGKTRDLAAQLERLGFEDFKVDIDSSSYGTRSKAPAPGTFTPARKRRKP